MNLSLKPEFIQVITTTDSKENAEKIAKTLLELRLAGCVQIIGPINSHYWWEGKIETSQEYLCLIKTKNEVYKKVEDAIKRVHKYSVPEIIACSISYGSQDYLDWLKKEVKKE